MRGWRSINVIGQNLGGKTSVEKSRWKNLGGKLSAEKSRGEITVEKSRQPNLDG